MIGFPEEGRSGREAIPSASVGTAPTRAKRARSTAVLTNMMKEMGVMESMKVTDRKKALG